MTLRLNCDLGEGFGSWKMGMDAAATVSYTHLTLPTILLV